MKHTTVSDQRIREIKAEQREDRKRKAIHDMHQVHNAALIVKIDPEEKA